MIDDKLRAVMRAEVAASGRFGHRWLVHATLKDMPWLLDRRGKAYTLNGADFAMSLNYLGETLSWTTLQSGVILFSPTRDMAIQSMQSDGILVLSASPFFTISRPWYIGLWNLGL